MVYALKLEPDLVLSGTTKIIRVTFIPDIVLPNPRTLSALHYLLSRFIE